MEKIHLLQWIFFQKRLGDRARAFSSHWKAEGQDINLVEAMGVKQTKRVKKKPAASSKATKKDPLTKRSKKKAEVVDVKPEGKKWHKLPMTYAKTGHEKAYLQKASLTTAQSPRPLTKGRP